jgi:predicted secreted protein
MRALLATLVITLAACSTTRDPHAPKTIVASGGGGSITLDHGQRLFIRLESDPASGYEWRRVEPMILTVVAVGAPLPQGMWFTPVRTGTEKLRFEYRPLSAEVQPQKVVSYDVTVTERTGIRAVFR